MAESNSTRKPRRVVRLSRVDQERLARGEIATPEEAVHLYDSHVGSAAPKVKIRKSSGAPGSKAESVSNAEPGATVESAATAPKAEPGAAAESAVAKRLRAMHKSREIQARDAHERELLANRPPHFGKL